MAKCAGCKNEEREWIWQPFGPGETPACVVAPGSQYRGFPAIALGAACHARLEAGGHISFSYKQQRFIGSLRDVQACL